MSVTMGGQHLWNLMPICDAQMRLEILVLSRNMHDMEEQKNLTFSLNLFVSFQLHYEARPGSMPKMG